MALHQAADGDSHVICIDGGDGNGDSYVNHIGGGGGGNGDTHIDGGDGNGDSHVINIDGGDDNGSVNRLSAPEHLDECAVCMESLEWVAVGACGHRAVCAGCTVRLRSRGDRRCCICRSYCHRIIVSETGGGEAATFGEELARLDACSAGECWYHSRLDAYFRDEKQYEATATACREPPPPPPAVRVQAAQVQDIEYHYVDTGGDDAYCWWLRTVALLFLLFIGCFMVGVLFG